MNSSLGVVMRGICKGLLIAVSLSLSVGSAFAVERTVRPTKKNPAVATSTVKVTTKATYGPEKAMDGDSRTGWCEGAKGDGVGESISLYLGDGKVMGGPQDVVVHLTRGLQTNWKTYSQNGMPTKVKVELFGGSKLLRSRVGKVENAFAAIELKDVPKTSGGLWVRVTILGVKQGTKWRDTCISEVRTEFKKANPHHVREFVKRVCLMVNEPKTYETNSRLKKLVKQIRKHFISDFDESKKPHCDPGGVNVLSDTDFELWGTEEGDGATILRFHLRGVMWDLKTVSAFTAWD